jgi:hypothetical protein
MSTTNYAIGEQINLAEVLNSKIESGVLQTELNLEAAGTLTGQATRYDEFIKEHVYTGTHKNGFLVDSYVSSNAQIQATKLAIHKNYYKSTSVVPATTASTNGTAITLTPPQGYSMIQPLGMDMIFGGTFNNETITITNTITYSDTTTTTVTYTSTATGTTSLTNSQLMALVKDGVYITSISTVAQSSIANTSATILINRYGLYL